MVKIVTIVLFVLELGRLAIAFKGMLFSLDSKIYSNSGLRTLCGRQYLFRGH